MRRWVAALGLGLILLLAGCAHGDITKDWGPMTAAKQFRPAAGTCHTNLDEATLISPESDYKPVSCTSTHSSETVAIFDLSPTDAATPEKRQAEAYAECSKRTTAWLGKDWRTGWTTILPMLPGDQGWTGGARWVRCDVAEVSPESGDPVDRTASLKGALKPGGKLLATCANPTVKGPAVTALHPAACSTKHIAEFAGLFTSKKSDPRAVTESEFGKGCYPVVAKFAGLRNDSNLQYRVGWMSFMPSEYAWERGDHAVRCFLWLPGKKTGSYHNAGPGKLPINYA
jgi:hypothetical protein